MRRVRTRPPPITASVRLERITDAGSSLVLSGTQHLRAGTTVTLSAPLGGNQKIYYTLDGTDPRPAAEGGPASGTTLRSNPSPTSINDAAAIIPAANAVTARDSASPSASPTIATDASESASASIAA